LPDGGRVLFFDVVRLNAAGHRIYARFIADNLRRLLADDPLAPNKPRGDDTVPEKGKVW